MLGTLIEKELKAILLSPKFVAVFAVCSILIILSIYIGIEEYRASIAHYEAVTAQVEEQMRGETNWRALSLSVMRYPDPMEIFVSGINNDIGRQSQINQVGVIKLYNSNYSENTIFSVFRSMDLMFIVQIVLSLFAILFTYDSICGERESGTLKLSFSNPVPRTKYIIAKLIGSWLGLVIPLLIPILLGIAMVLIYSIPMTASHWIQLCIFIGLSILYFSAFICIGVLFSAISRGPSNSFLYLLVIWVSFVLIIPRAGVMVAGQFIPVPTSAEISSKLTQKYRERVEQYVSWQKKESEKLSPSYESLKDLPPEEREARTKEIFDGYITKLKEEQNRMTQDIAKYDAFLNEDWRNRKAEREKLGFSLSRFSPASAFQLAAMDLAGTGMSLKTNYEDQMRAYSDAFNKFRAKKEAEAGNNVFFNPFEGKQEKTLDINELPRFKYMNPDLASVFESTIIDIGILSLYILLALGGTFIVFIRYDVR